MHQSISAYLTQLSITLGLNRRLFCSIYLLVIMSRFAKYLSLSSKDNFEQILLHHGSYSQHFNSTPPPIMNTLCCTYKSIRFVFTYCSCIIICSDGDCFHAASMQLQMNCNTSFYKIQYYFYSF